MPVITKQVFERFMGHPLVGARPWNLLRMFRTRGVDPEFRGRALRVFLLSLAGAPFTPIERLLYGRKIRKHRLSSPPVFILGHWRTGTTHLHNLMSQDPAFAVLTYFQVYFQNYALLNLRLHRRLLELALPKTRPMDEMALGVDLPAEEEFALGCVDDVGIINGIWFPRQLLRYLGETVLFERADGSQDAPSRQRWQDAYRRVVTKASIAGGGRPLLLKNPANTGRVSALLDLYPDARFIHIYRNPYLVFPSTVVLYERLMERGAFQRTSRDQLEELVLAVYTRVMDRFEAERSLIPPQNLVEVRFEDLEREPLVTLESVYTQLGLPGFDAVRPSFESYVSQQKNYRKNTHRLDHAVIRRVEERWGDAVRRWGYTPPEPGIAP